MDLKVEGAPLDAAMCADCLLPGRQALSALHCWMLLAPAGTTLFCDEMHVCAFLVCIKQV
jgi:hypothetical protein